MAPSQFFALTSADRLAMVALHDLDASTCSCGQPWEESTQTEAATDYHVKGIVCHACAALSRAQEKSKTPGEHLLVRKVWDHRTDEWLVPESERPDF